MSDMDNLELEKFFQLFPFRGNSLIKQTEAGSWRFISQFHCLTDEEILSAATAEAKTLRACSFDVLTHFAVISIPAGSSYNNSAAYTKLKTYLNSFALALKPYKAAGSNDIHIYIFFTGLANSSAIHNALASLLDQEDFSLAAEDIVLYPCDLPLAFPLQRGFAWLDDDLLATTTRESLTGEEALAQFLIDIQENEIPAEYLLKPSTSRIIRLSDKHENSPEQIAAEPEEQELLEESADNTDNFEPNQEYSFEIGILPPVGTETSQ